MKTLLSFLASLLLIANINTTIAQNMEVDSSSNWQQYISTILGGSCIEISNVQYTSGPQASANFSNGLNTIGINKGIVITTGSIYDIVSPPSFFLSTFNNLPGDSLLTSLGGFTSYDASILEFDFASPIDDTVKVNYVFASEEYPEFVNMGFNDIFGFFVSGGNYNNLNIALLPNSSTPVSINTVNHLMNTNYYVSTPENQFFAYNGRTVPLAAKFYAEAGITYHLKIAIADLGDGVFDSAVFLESFELSPQNISGQALLNGNPLEAGIVELFGLNTDSTQANLVATVNLDETGNYAFENLEAASYILKATPDPISYPNALPKYYSNAYSWDAATILTLPCMDYNFGLSFAPVMNGGSSISGTVFYTNNTLRTSEDFEGEGIADINVLLYSYSHQEVIRITKSDELGNYDFTGLEAGNYKVIVDIPGLYHAAFHEIQLNENHSIEAADYLVGLNKIIIQSPSPLSSSSLSSAKFNVFPQPFKDVFYIQSSESMRSELYLYDLSGRIIKSISTLQIDANTPYAIPSNDLPSGIYVLEIKSANSSQFIKLLK